MAKTERSWDILSKEERRQAVDEIIYFFDNERDEMIGNIAAEIILDFILQTLGTRIYNKGVEDSNGYLRERMEDIQIDMASLLKEH